MRSLLVLLALIAVLPASYAEFDPAALQLGPDQGIYRKDGLLVQVVLVNDPNSFLREWKNPANPGSPRVITRSAFHRGDIVLPVILYQTDGLNPDGKAEIRYRMVFKRPDGSIYEDMRDKVVVDGVPPRGVGLFQEMMGLKIEDNDPYGPYTLEVEITDRVKNVTVPMSFLFTVTDPEAEEKVLLDVTPAAAPQPSVAPGNQETAPPPGSGPRVRTSTPAE